MSLHPDPVFDRLLGDPGAADPAAVAAAARRLRAGDVPGWERFWRAEGDRAVRWADDRLAVDDVVAARQALLAGADAYGLAAHLCAPDEEGHRANRAAQVAAFRAALPLLPGPAEIVAPDAYLFRAAGAVCAAVPLPDGTGAEAGYARFAVPARAHGVDCLVLGGTVPVREALPRAVALVHGRLRCPLVLVGRGPAGPTVIAAVPDDPAFMRVVWCPPEDAAVARSATRSPTKDLPPGTSVDVAMAWIAGLVPHGDEEVRRPWGRPWSGW